MSEERKLRYAMVGGGLASRIGASHRDSIALTGYAQLVAGCFSRDMKKNREAGTSFNIPEENIFASYQDLAKYAKELELDFVVVVTRPLSHYEICRAFLEVGVAVACDKPLTFSLEEAVALQALVKEKNIDFMMTYTYAAYPMVLEARERILAGEIGEIRLAQANYQQGWMQSRYEVAEDKSSFWRTQASDAGISCCVGDIGVHAEYIVRFLTNNPIERLSANLQSFTDGHTMDDNAFILAQHGNNLHASYWCSQVCVGRANSLDVEIVGSKGAILWKHDRPDELKIYKVGAEDLLLHKTDENISQIAKERALFDVDIPETMYEAFASLYAAFSRTLLAKKAGKIPSKNDIYPSIDDGVKGMRFVYSCVESNQKNQEWMRIE